MTVFSTRVVMSSPSWSAAAPASRLTRRTSCPCPTPRVSIASTRLSWWTAPTEMPVGLCHEPTAYLMLEEWLTATCLQPDDDAQRSATEPGQHFRPQMTRPDWSISSGRWGSCAGWPLVTRPDSRPAEGPPGLAARRAGELHRGRQGDQGQRHCAQPPVFRCTRTVARIAFGAN